MIKIKILLIHPITSPLYAAQLANALSEKGNAVIVMVPMYSCTKEIFNSHIRVIRLDTSQSYPKMFLKTINPLTYVNIFRSIKEIDPDVIHITWDLVWFNIMAPVLRRNWPLIVTDHEPIAKDTEITFYGKYIYRCTRFLTRKLSDGIIVHTSKLKEYLLAKGVPPNKAFVIPHGIYNYYNRWESGNYEETNIILFFGLIENYKGIRYLIEAEPIITAQIPNAKIVIAGKGDFSKYRMLIKNSTAFEIINEYIPDEKVAELFERASLVVLPYTDAAQSGVLTIAYSFRKPLVVTNVGGLPEAVVDGETGLIVPPYDPYSLANAIIKILSDDRLRKSMVLAISKKAVELSWENIAIMTENAYDDVIQNRSCQ